MIVLGLLVLNYVIMALFAPGREPSVTIPYSSQGSAPGFVQFVDQGKVARVKMEGSAVTGEFKSEVKYPDEQGQAGQELRHRAADADHL